MSRKKTVQQQVNELNSRVNAQMGTTRLILRVQMEQLAMAEKLRRAAKALVRSQWQHRCDDKGTGCTAVSESALTVLEDLLKGITSFHDPRKRVSAKLEAMTGVHRGRKTT